MQKEQILYWSVSLPLRWLGLTIDEWIILLLGIIPGLFMLNNRQFINGITFIIGEIILCYLFKKFKKVSEFFLIRSWLLSRGYIAPSSKFFPHILGKLVYK